ncbi:uncharacterized protein LOC105436010 [Cucumis sativus]|nr:uncharacterized protein LOC105436010 [Cucumis sativus]
MTIVIIFMIIFFAGDLYLILTWQLSKTVAVLEELCGFKAMARSKALVKGKMRMVIKLFSLLSLPIEVVQLVFSHFLVQSTIVGIVGKLVLIIIWMLLLSFFLLVSLVAQTVLYFVCKSYHQELAEKLSISDRLQRYLLTHYDPLKVEDDVPTEKLQIV